MMFHPYYDATCTALYLAGRRRHLLTLYSRRAAAVLVPVALVTGAFFFVL